MSVDLDAIRARHSEIDMADAGGENYCDKCLQPWPCDAIQLCDEVEGIRRAFKQRVQDEDAIKFVFRALSAGELETLRLAHPSTDKDSNFNVETFPAALLAAACTQAGDDDGLTVDEAEAVWATFSEGDCVALYNAAWGVATTANLRPFSVADTGNADQNSVPNSTTAPPEALHIATS